MKAFCCETMDRRGPAGPRPTINNAESKSDSRYVDEP